ncbi:ribosomal-protein-alanine N-acetyltransferase [Streptomyces nigrescens]|uniref:Ribosomal-protein-alanine N-acetyltransferase n=1 Tax=Streptomyces nigrescens TaxID=1920 RepID=A0ABN6R4M3_STRNI|nr:GNAT family N-acetyltransferase [Streptomyces nigrescens]BDM73345.1 ribosomal-protein-alanine N-acetyltransferase [Streptomyces nigrescens]
MNTAHFPAGTDERPVVVTRVAEQEWHALAGDHVVGCGDVSRRPDGRIFVSIDAWHGAAFGRLVQAMLADLPRPLYTLVDEADRDAKSRWERVGFTTRRREWEYFVPTDPRVTRLDAVRPPAGVTIVPAGEAEEGPLRALDRALREEVEATVGWQAMPAEVLPRPHGVTVVDPSKYAVAAASDQYVGLVRVAPVTRLPRIGLIAVRAGWRRRGTARALLAHVLGSLHRTGIERAAAEVTESNAAATALFDGIGAQRASSNLELVCR